jgi:hypothetical protein
MHFSVQSISMSTRLRGFTSAANAHEHLFKHVIPLGRHFPIYRRERWEELIAMPPLTADHERRVEEAGRRLAEAAGCRLGHEDDARCADCRDGNARWEIDLAFAPQLSAYVAQAQATLDFAFTNPTHAGEPRALATRSERGWRLETVDPRGVRLFAQLPQTGGDPAVITCYRDLNYVAEGRGKKRYQSMWLDLNRQKAGSRRNGTALELVVGGGS